MIASFQSWKLSQVSLSVMETFSLVATKHWPSRLQVFVEQKDLLVKGRGLANKRGKIIYYAPFLDISREGTAPRKSIQSKETGTSKFV